MNEFTLQWLTLRESADHRARCGFDDALHALRSDKWSIVDLGSGGGSNLRYLAPRLRGEQRWICVDHDISLLSTIRETSETDARRTVVVVQRNLATDIDELLAYLHEKRGSDSRILITASALLDLVSAAWVDALVATCARIQAPALFALTYDGQIELTPADRDDQTLIRLVNEHQLSDKGFGPALGPQASDYARRAFAAAGFEVQSMRSDWVLDAGDRNLQRELIDGWVAVAGELLGDDSRLERWHTQRKLQTESGQLQLRVGHCELLALPDADRS